ncbi:hypothetical protein D9M70_534180 [compost metagenome]
MEQGLRSARTAGANRFRQHQPGTAGHFGARCRKCRRADRTGFQPRPSERTNHCRRQQPADPGEDRRAQPGDRSARRRCRQTGSAAVSAAPGSPRRTVPAVRERPAAHLPGPERPDRRQRPRRQPRRPSAVQQRTAQLPAGRRPGPTGGRPQLQQQRRQLHQALYLPSRPEDRLQREGKGAEEDRVHQRQRLSG